MPVVRFLRGGREVLLDAGAPLSLLDHALAAGLPVSYSCRRGDCGQCVGTLLGGEVRPIDPTRPIARPDGIYLCNAVADSDLVVEIPYFAELESIRLVRSPCKIHALERLSEDVLLVSLRLPPAARFEFLAGQYIRLTNQSGVTRSYSLATAPGPDKLLQIHVRSVGDGAFSRYLFELAKIGDLLRLEGPSGSFVLRDGVTVGKTVFLATGTGIAPIHALLTSLDEDRLRRCGELFLYWGNRRQSDAYFQGPLKDLAQRLRLRYFAVFSGLSSLAAAQFPRHVQDLMASQHSDLADAQVFAAGNAGMVNDARARCLSLGLPAARFFSDPFTAS